MAATSTFSITISDSGITIPTYQELFDALRELHQSTFDTDTDTEEGESSLDLDVTSPDGMAVALQARQLRLAFEAMQSMASQFYVATATGIWLDRLAALKGLTRNDGETDDELRARILAATTTGLATYDGMLTYLRDQLGNAVTMLVNDADEADEGDTDDAAVKAGYCGTELPRDYLPAHSFAVFAPINHNSDDAAKDAVAQAIWDCKPAGIEAHAHAYYASSDSETGARSFTGTATDSEGATHEVGFYSLEECQVCMTLEVVAYDSTQWTDEDELVEAVKAAVDAQAASLIESDPTTFSVWSAITPVYSIGVQAAGVSTITVLADNSTFATWNSGVGTCDAGAVFTWVSAADAADDSSLTASLTVEVS